MLKWRFPILSDDDFLYEEGSKDKMLALLAVKLNKTEVELEAVFAELQLC